MIYEIIVLHLIHKNSLFFEFKSDVMIPWALRDVLRLLLSFRLIFISMYRVRSFINLPIESIGPLRTCD